jgi:REP-associated tyrosine transposase
MAGSREGILHYGLCRHSGGGGENWWNTWIRAAEEGRKSGVVPLLEAADGRMSHLRRGWYWGPQEFAQWALEFADALVRKGNGEPTSEAGNASAHGVEQAEKLLKEGLVLAGLGKESLAALPANDARKVKLARLVWKKTTASPAWIAQRLGMHNAANVSLTLHRIKKRRKELPTELAEFIKMQSDAPAPHSHSEFIKRTLGERK